ncbi:hypothetical protein HK099_001256, partial [Clydaea vesicula]
MIEAVGPEFLDSYFNSINKYLKLKTGIAVIQAITLPELRYADYCKKTDFIQKYIFPGGHCPSLTAITNAVFNGSNGYLVVDNVENIGPHYSKALRLWREKFDNSFEMKVLKNKKNLNEKAKDIGLDFRYDSTFKLKWDFYFSYCEAGFSSRSL